MMIEVNTPAKPKAPVGCGFRWWYGFFVTVGMFAGCMVGTIIPSVQDWVAVQLHCPNAESYERITRDGGTMRSSTSGRTVKTTVSSVTCYNADGSKEVISNDTRFLSAFFGTLGLSLVGSVVLSIPIAWWMARSENVKEIPT